MPSLARSDVTHPNIRTNLSQAEDDRRLGHLDETAGPDEPAF